jgi:hypothetical protein
MPFPSEKAATAGKPTFSASKSAGQQTVVTKSKDPDLAFVPALVKHMTLAIYQHKFGGSAINEADEIKHGKAPTGGKNFATAFAIARGLLADNRHLTPGSRHGAIGKINLTSSGRLLDSKHRREPGGGKKTATFDNLYMRFLAPPIGKPSEKNTEQGQKPKADVSGKETIKSAFKKGVAVGYKKARGGL